jgi:hypothetical protein
LHARGTGLPITYEAILPRIEKTGITGGGPNPSAEQAGGTAMVRIDTRRQRPDFVVRARERARMHLRAGRAQPQNSTSWQSVNLRDA